MNETKRKLDDAGASEINRLYPESRRKVEKERAISEFTPRRGEAGGRERPTRTKLDWNEKEKSLQGETYRRHSRWNEARASLNTDPSSDERQMRLNIVKCSD
ncbi:hypothetical protein TNCV_1728651 [Trichonephila clavipes]|nr:hypothetical protein TNCV_1728651 [Trichonephila clavipes]